MTIREYADTRGITYEAARQMVHKCQAELAGHASTPTSRGALELDGAAVALLDRRRAADPRVAELSRLRAIAGELQDEVNHLQTALMDEQSENIKLKREIASLQEQLKEAQEKASAPWWRRVLGWI